jgi:NTP pyrophosphatase (non-canonical NTP hydrolase)
MTIKELMIKSNQTAREKGFWDGELNKIEHRNDSELLMLMVTELGEACEALRHGNPPSEHIPEFSAVEEELADCMIRIADMAEMRGYKLEEALEAKLLFNKSRPYKHNKEF